MRVGSESPSHKNSQTRNQAITDIDTEAQPLQLDALISKKVANPGFDARASTIKAPGQWKTCETMAQESEMVTSPSPFMSLCNSPQRLVTDASRSMILKFQPRGGFIVPQPNADPAAP